MQNSGAKCRRRWVELLKSTSFYRFTVIPNEVRNPVISSFAKQDFTGWGKPQPLRLGYIHASMVATLTLRVLLNGSAIFVQARLRHRCFASCYRLGYKIASYLASLALRHFRLGAYSPFEVVFVTTFLRMTVSIKVQDDGE